MYHAYVDTEPGLWQRAVDGHFEALEESGLSDALYGPVLVGIVGPPDPRRELLERLQGRRVELLVEADTGWEQVTQLAAIPRFGDADAWLYAHTKGASTQSTPLNRQWRRYMTDWTVRNWPLHASALEAVDVTGASWFTETVTGEPFPKGMWGCVPGTFWWATTEYLNGLPPPRTTDRYGAEDWIGWAHEEPLVWTADPRPWNPSNWSLYASD